MKENIDFVESSLSLGHGNNIVYFLPCKPGSIYINITKKCLNNCLFCIRRDGNIFFGCDLSLNEHEPETKDIVNALKKINGWPSVNEVVFCGMGEPLLRYNTVVDTSKMIRTMRGTGIRLRVDTSGLFWNEIKSIEILNWIDILSVSLNAETAEKYERLCKPTIGRAYDILMDFLRNVKYLEGIRKKQGLHFPEIRLSVVNTSEEQFIPVSGRSGYDRGIFPIPDFKECEKIANSFGWPLVVKRLFRDSRDKRWNNRSFEELCARGISLDDCKNCSFRH